MNAPKKIIICLFLAFSLLFVSCQKDVVGIAWRTNTQSESYQNVCTTLDDLNIAYVLIPEIKDTALPYDGDFIAEECINEHDYLIQEYADIVKSRNYKDTNIRKAMKHVKAVIFPGGEDMSPTLFEPPVDWHGIEEEKDFDVTRDVSDYLLMAWCLDNDIPVLGICRGEQVMGIVAGATMIQDIPAWFESKGLPYNHDHRPDRELPEEERDYVPNSVNIDSSSILYSIYQTETLAGCPSWHHQAVGDLSGTDLVLTGTTVTSGIKLVEAIEIPGKKFAVGIQFHPEVAYAYHLKDMPNKDLFMDKETAAKIFITLDSVSR